MEAPRMRPFKALLSKDQALDALLAAATPVAESEDVTLDAASGRALARDVRASIDVPAFTRSAMDGFAVRAEDTWGATRTTPRTLAIVGVVHAGDAPKRRLARGEAIQIATGGRIPEGADAVVRVEDTDAKRDVLLVRAAVPPMANVSKQGGDVHRGEVVLRAGEALNAARVGLLASLGVPRVAVARRPRVAVVPTGNEVAEPGEPLREGQVYNSNSWALEALFREHGADVRRFPIVPDTREALERVLARDAADADLVVFTGGSSVGERDLLVDAVRAHGEVLVHGVQVKPGKPLLVGRVLVGGKRRLVVGLPGYPTSCVTNAHVFVVPAVRKLAHLPPLARRTVRATLGEKVVSNLGRYQILPVRLEAGKAYSTFKESGTLTSVAHADGYVGIPDNVDLMDEGDEVEVVLW